jgi:hypothetical protein
MFKAQTDKEFLIKRIQVLEEKVHYIIDDNQVEISKDHIFKIREHNLFHQIMFNAKIDIILTIIHPF